MKASVKICEKCLRNQKFCVHLLLPNRREYTTTKDILVSCSNLFGRSLVALLPRVVVTVWQNKRGCALSVYTYIKRIFDLQCQTVSRICSRRKVRRVQTYSLRNRLNLSLTSQIGRSQNLFAKFKTLRTFVSANVIYKVHIVYLYRSIAGFLRSYFVRHVCQNTRGLRSFCTHTLTNFCTSQWQTWTRVVFQRKALILLHSLYNRLNLSSISQIGRSQSVYNHSLWTILKSSPRCFVYLCMSF